MNTCVAFEDGATYPLSLVHPDVYLSRVQMGFQAMEKVRQIARVFSKGGMFRVTVDSKGSFTISRV